MEQLPLKPVQRESNYWWNTDTSVNKPAFTYDTGDQLLGQDNESLHLALVNGSEAGLHFSPEENDD